MMRIGMLNQKRRQSGMVLYVVLWAIVILSIMAIGMGRRIHVDLSLTKHAINKIKSKQLAWAGIVTAMNEIRKDSDSKETRLMDNLYYCAIDSEPGESHEERFFSNQMENGSFKVHDGKRFGMRDEERRLNINAINAHNKGILESLVRLLGFDQKEAMIVSSSIVDWTDNNRVAEHKEFGAEDDYYKNLENPYLAKNLPLDSIAELKLIRGVTDEIYEALIDYVTIFPKKGSLAINFDTASEPVLKAVAYIAVGSKTQATHDDADGLVGKLMAYRAGNDSLEYTDDDQSIRLEVLRLNKREAVIMHFIKPFRTKVSNFIRVVSIGKERAQSVETQIKAIIKRDDLSIVDWQEI